MRFLRVIILFILFTGCGSQWHLEKAIAKNPDIARDTIVKIDTTIITESVSIVDTFIVNKIDTIRIEKNGASVEIHKFYDTLAVDVECPSDTITIFKQAKVRQVLRKEPTGNKIIYGLIGFGIALIVIIIISKVIK